MSEAAEKAAHEVRQGVEAALVGVDEPVIWAPAQGTRRLETPRRRRPDITVVHKRKKGALNRLFWLVLLPVIYLTDPIGNFFDWLFEKLSFRREKRALRGGWGSLAGGLVAAHGTFVRRFLVVGRTALHVVYIGELGSEVGWSVPREKVRGVEHLEWEGGMPHKATLRFHFTDGSWGDLVVIGQAWQQMLSRFPSVPAR